MGQRVAGRSDGVLQRVGTALCAGPSRSGDLDPAAAARRPYQLQLNQPLIS
jgi:hypothetical protein